MMRRFQKILSSRLPSVVWTILIFILLSLPGKLLPNENHLSIPNLDKLVHMILFGTFVFLWSFYFALKPENVFLRNNLISIFIIACLYGTGMEYVQKYFIPNRDFDIYDIAADIFGALLGFIVVRMTVFRMKK